MKICGYLFVAFLTGPVLSFSAPSVSDAERECREGGEQAVQQKCYGNPPCAIQSNQKTLKACQQWMKNLAPPVLPYGATTPSSSISSFTDQK